MIDAIFLFLAKAITLVTGIFLLVAPIVVLFGLFRCIYLLFCPNKAHKTRDNISV